MPDHPLPPRIPQVAVDICRACRRCLAREVCRSKALRAVDPGEPPWVDGNRCYGCWPVSPSAPSVPSRFPLRRSLLTREASGKRYKRHRQRYTPVAQAARPACRLTACATFYNQ